MTVEFKSAVTSNNTNTAYVSKKVDDEKNAKLKMDDLAGDSGTAIENTQKTINQVMDTSGETEDDANRKVYGANYIADGDNRKVAHQKVDAQVKTNADNITQNSNDITDINNSIGQPNGIAPTDSNNKIPLEHMPNGVKTLKGTWDANLNIPTLADSVSALFISTVLIGAVPTAFTVDADFAGGDGNNILLEFNGVLDIDAVIALWNIANPSNTATLSSGSGADVPDDLEVMQLIGGTDTGNAGWCYNVAVAGSQDFGSGLIAFNINDSVVLSADGVWFKQDFTDEVVSVHGRVGAIIGETSDYNADQVDETNSRYFDVKNNNTALIEPTQTDDSTLFYTEGSTWFVPSTGKKFTLQDSSAGFAIWIETGGGGGGIELARDFVIPVATSTTVTFANENYVYASGGNQFFRNGVLLVRELASGDAWSIDPLIAPTEYKEVDLASFSNEILINPNSPASGLTEFSLVSQANITGGVGDDVLLLMAKGSLLASDGANNGELSVGADGEVLTADSAEDAGVKWQAVGGVAVGTVSSFAGGSVPSGYLLCDGSAIDRTTYASLYTSIADAFGEGDGATTFNIPDFRGRFLRGTDSGATNDPDSLSRTASGVNGNTGDAIGSYQADEAKPHTHTTQLQNTQANANTPAQCNSLAIVSDVSARIFHQSNPSHSINITNNSTGSESRPKNINVNYIIKY